MPQQTAPSSPRPSSSPGSPSSVSAPTSTPLLSPLSEEGLQRFYKANNVKGLCTECGTNSWSVDGITGASVGVPVLALVNQDGQTGTAFFPLLILTCQNCGNLKMFSRKRVQAWLEANPK